MGGCTSTEQVAALPHDERAVGNKGAAGAGAGGCPAGEYRRASISGKAAPSLPAELVYSLPVPSKEDVTRARCLRPGTKLTRAICEGNTFVVIALLDASAAVPSTSRHSARRTSTSFSTAGAGASTTCTTGSHLSAPPRRSITACSANAPSQSRRKHRRGRSTGGAATASRSASPAAGARRKSADGAVPRVPGAGGAGGGSDDESGGESEVDEPAREPSYTPCSHRRRSVSWRARITSRIRGVSDIDKPDQGLTPLCWAAMAGHQDICEVLIRHGANVNFVNPAGLSPLLLAACRGRINAMWLLLACGSGMPVKPEAAGAGEGDGGAPGGEQAGERRRSSGKKKRRSGGAAPSPPVELSDASRGVLAHWETARELPPRSTAIGRAALLQMSDAVFLGRVAAIACCFGRFATLTQALDMRADLVHFRDDTGTTLVSFAAQHGNSHLVAELVRRGADVNVQNDAGASPIMRAAQGGYEAAVDVLLRNGADPNLRSSTGWSPLMSACLRGSLDICELLLEHGAHPNARTALGRSALVVAAASGHKDICSALLEGGADPACETAEGMTAINFCRSKSTARLLYKAGGRAGGHAAAQINAEAAGGERQGEPSPRQTPAAAARGTVAPAGTAAGTAGCKQGAAAAGGEPAAEPAPHHDEALPGALDVVPVPEKYVPSPAPSPAMGPQPSPPAPSDAAGEPEHRLHEGPAGFGRGSETLARRPGELSAVAAGGGDADGVSVCESDAAEAAAAGNVIAPMPALAI